MASSINLADIPSDGLLIDCEIQPSEMVLPSDDGQILGSMNCAGQIFLTDDQRVHFQGDFELRKKMHKIFK